MIRKKDLFALHILLCLYENRYFPDNFMYIYKQFALVYFSSALRMSIEMNASTEKLNRKISTCPSLNSFAGFV